MERVVLMEADSQTDCSDVNLEELSIEEIRQRTSLILNGFLETGECDVNSLYSMLKTLSRHASRLSCERNNCDDKVTDAENRLLEEAKNAVQRFSLLEKMFYAVKQPETWGSFSEAHKQKIESWQKNFENAKSIYAEILKCYDTGDSEMFKSEDKLDEEQKRAMSKEIHELREEGKLLSEQLRAVNDVKRKLERQLFMKKVRIQQLETYERSRKQMKAPSSENISANIEASRVAHIISLISVFLNAHPFGANINYICSYLNQFDSTIKASDVESLLEHFPSLFCEKCTGIGATFERKWMFCVKKMPELYP